MVCWLNRVLRYVYILFVEMVVAEMPAPLAAKMSSYVGRKVRYLCVAGNMRSKVLNTIAGKDHVVSPFHGNAAQSVCICVRWLEFVLMLQI